MTLDAEAAFKDWSLKSVNQQRTQMRALFRELASLHNDWSTRVADYGDDTDTIGTELDTLARTACDLADLFPQCAKKTS